MAISSHPFAPEDIQSYADGELPADEARRLETHVATCEECTGVLNGLRHVSREMAEWHVEVPASFVAPRVPSVRPLWARRELQIAAVVVLGVGLVWLVRPSSGPTSYATMAPERVDNMTPGAALTLEDFERRRGGGTVGELRSESATKEGQGRQGQFEGQFEGQGQGQDRPRRSVSARQPAEAEASGQAMVARTAFLRVVATDFAGVRPLIEQTVDQMGGFLGRLDSAGADREPQRLNATIRVPSSRLADALTAFRTLGAVTSESQGGEDVTEQAVDLNARLTNARETEKRLVQVLQQRTGKVGEVLEVEREIARVRQEIEQMTAQRTTLERRVTYATVTLEVTEEKKAALDLGPESVPGRLRNALIEGTTGATELVIAIAAFVIRLAPTVVLLVVVAAWPVFALRRRLRLSRG